MPDTSRFPHGADAMTATAGIPAADSDTGTDINTGTGINTDTDEARWHAVRARDRRADGRFVYAVRTTGVCCRPSCASRPARRENIRFFPTVAAAQAQGFRPCKRCRPDLGDDRPTTGNTHADLVAAACAILTEAEEAPGLEALARRLAVSPHHLHRVFRSVTGVTPKAFAAAERARRLRQGLERGESVTEAIYGAGFNSSSRFYETSLDRLGMRASDYRKGAAGQRIRFAVGTCSLGPILVAATERGICAIEFGDSPERLVEGLRQRFAGADLIGDDPAFGPRVAEVIAAVETPDLASRLPLDVRGTAFQERVWQALRAIPIGETATYAEIAARIGAPSATRAVANACGANTLAVAIPCHRVVRTDGSLGGYRWGIARKDTLLARENGTG